MHTQTITLHIFEEDGKRTINSVLLTLPNGDEHLSADIRTIMGTDLVDICLSRTTLVKGDKSNETMAKDLPKICQQVQIEVNAEYEGNPGYISYLTCSHPLFDIKHLQVASLSITS